ncbi:hypothetical protein ABTB59_19010, partial [Acinetobacter baumannii]
VFSPARPEVKGVEEEGKRPPLLLLGPQGLLKSPGLHEEGRETEPVQVILPRLARAKEAGPLLGEEEALKGLGVRQVRAVPEGVEVLPEAEGV